MESAQDAVYKPFNPEFLIIPYQLFTDKRLDRADALVYGLIYWFEHLKDGRCTASNATIGEYLWMNPKSIGNSINRLTKCGYISAYYADPKKKIRLKMSTNVNFVHMKRVPSTDGRGSIQKQKTFHPQMDRERNTKKVIKDRDLIIYDDEGKPVRVGDKWKE